MGRRRASVVSIISDSSPSSSAESSFRELDDAFLQSQTRIWLGEVLNMRLDEDVHISDLLADGELLSDVSKVVWNKLLTKCAELWHLKPNLKGPLLSRKSSGRYMPYSNVDSFLKICKILGLNDIDLLSPSDVVERRNTRKVCICIRALSKKARSKQLQVPDFDIVTYTVAMSTDMVGCIRRSLESSQSGLSSSSSNSLHIQSTLKLRQLKRISRGDGNDDSCSEESDEAESNYMGANSHCSTINKLGHAASTNLNLENSPGAHSSTKEKQYTSVQCASQYDIEKDDTSEFGNGQYKSPDISRSVKSTAKNSRNAHLVNSKSLDHANSRSKLHDSAPYLNIQESQSKSAANLDLAYRHDDLVTADTLGDCASDNDYISEYLAFSDSVVFGVDGCSPVLPDGEDNSYNFFMGIDARGSDFKGSIYENENQRKDSDVEDEVSSTTSMSSILGRVLNMEFDDKFDLDDSSTSKDHSKGLLGNETEQNREKGSLIICETQGMDKCELPSHGLTSDAREHLFENKAENLGFFSDFIRPSHDEQLPILESHDEIVDSPPSKVSHQACPNVENVLDSSSSKSSFRESDDAFLQKGISYKDTNMVESITDLGKDTNGELPLNKPRQKLLRTVAKGTAIIGVLFLLLQVRRRGGDKDDKASKKSGQMQSFRLSQKGSTGNSVNGIYPAEKLKLGN